MSESPRFTILGKAISFLLVIGLVALGAFMLMRGRTGNAPASETATEGGDPAISEVQVEVPRLSPPAAFNYKDNIVPIEISEYAGYAGLIAANGGLEPSENSLFFKNHGFKVKLTVSEDESWSELNEGKIAGSVTTVDVLAAYGRQLHAVVPAQIGFSRGADGLIVKTDIKRINQLKGPDHRGGPVHRGRFLHSLPGAGGRPPDSHARQSGRDTASGPVEPDLRRRRLRGG